MKMTALSAKSAIGGVIFVAMLVWVCHAVEGKHEPNGGYVTDAAAATDIAKVVLDRMLRPGDVRKANSKAELKNGVWTVRCYGVPSKVWSVTNSIMLQIRQKTGAVIQYNDPEA